MAIPDTQAELLHVVKLDFERFIVDLESVPASIFTTDTMTGHKKGSSMSPHNLCAYILGWGKLVLEWNEDLMSGNEVVFPHPDYKWTELGDLAIYFYQMYENLTRKEIIDSLRKNVFDIESVISASPDLYERKWYKDYTMGRMIQLNTSSPYKNARTRIRKWIKGQNLS